MSSCFEISRVLPKGVQGDGGEEKTLLSAAMHLLLTSFNRVKLIHSPKNPLNSACKETIRRIDLSQIFLHRAAKLFLNALENVAQVMGLQMISRKYRQGFTRNYRSLMPSDKRLYRIDVLEAGQECHTSLWVNGIKYNLDEDVLLVNQKFRESWDALLCELEKILRELQGQENHINTCDASCNFDTPSFMDWGDAYFQKDWLAILGPALLQFDKSWTYFERHYINNLICIEKRSRQIIMDCIYAEEELRLYERLYDKFLQCSPEDTTMSNKNTTQINELVCIIRTAYIDFLTKVSNLQHATTFDKDSTVCYTFEKLERAFSLIQTCSSHDLKLREKYKANYRCLLSKNQCSTWIETLPQQHIAWILPSIFPLADQFQNLREILHGFSFNPERVDPYILQNVSLISLLQQMEKSWSLVMPYIENRLKMDALISFLNFLNYVLTSYYTFIKQGLETTNTCSLETFNKSFFKNDLTKLLSFPHVLILYSLSSFCSSVDHLCHLNQLVPTLFKELDQNFHSVNHQAPMSEKTLNLQFFDLHLKLTKNPTFRNILMVEQDLQPTCNDFSTIFLCLLSKGSQIAQDLYTQETSSEIFLRYVFHKSIQLMPNGNIFTPFFETCQNFMTKTNLLNDFITFFDKCGNQLKQNFSTEMNPLINIASLCFATSSLKSQLIDSKNENYKAAQDVLLTAHTLPEAEKIAFELIKVGLTEPTDTSAEETNKYYVFYGLLIIYELITRLGWNTLVLEKQYNIKMFLLQLSTSSHPALSSYLTQNKLAAVITTIATVEWPEKWPELFSTLQATPCYNSTVIALISLRDLINICYNLSTCPNNLCLERQRIIARNLEKGVSEISIILQNASFFITNETPCNKMTLQAAGNRNEDTKLTLIKLILDCISSFSSSTVIIAGLIERQVDELLFSILVNFPIVQQETLSVILTFVEALGRRQRRGLTLIESITVHQFQRLALGINSMSQVLSTPTDSCKVFRGKISIALIIRTYIEKCGFSIINQWKAFSIEDLWKFCILPCICNASFTVANHATFSVHLLIAQFKTKLPEWLLIPQILALLLFRFCRQGDPCLRFAIHCLSSEWQKDSTNDNVWPILNLFAKIFEKVNLSKEWIPTWFNICDTTIYLEHMIDNEDFDVNDDWSPTLPNNEDPEFLQLQKSTTVNSTFSKKFSSIKTTATFPILNLWLAEMDQRQEIFNFINLAWDVFVSCTWVASPLDSGPFQFLERVKYNTPPSKLLEGVSERLKPYVSASYIFMDGLFSFIELLAHKEKLNMNFNNNREQDLWKDAAINFFTKVLSYNFKDSEMMFFLEIRRLTFIEAVPSLLCAAHMNASLILQFIFEKIFFTDASVKASTAECFVFNKDIEESDLDAAYFIRRRALYALISYCQNSSENIRTLLEPIMERVKQRLASESIQQVERSLLIQSMVSIAAASKNYNVQKWFGSEILENFKQTMASLHLSEITQNINTFVVFFFGQTTTWTCNKNELSKLIVNRRKLIRFVSQIGAILQYAIIPIKLQELKNGDYVMEEYKEAIPLQSTESNEGRTQDSLSQMDFSQDTDFSHIFKFALRHPMSDFVFAMLPAVLKILSVYNNIWVNASLLQTHPHLSFLLAVGEEEWKALAGDVPTNNECNTMREYVDKTFPSNYSTVSVDDVRIVRRQNFHLRILLYRCLGRMSQVYTAFFSYPCIQKEMRQFIFHEANMAPFLHLSNSLEYFWQSFFSEESLLALQTYSTVSILNLLHHIFLPLLMIFQNRIRFELEKISQEQKACTEEQNTCSDFLIRGYSLIRVENFLLNMVTELVNLKGFIFNKKKKTNSLYAINEGTNEAKTTSNFCLSDDVFECNIQCTETSRSSLLTQLKQFLHYDVTFLQGIVSFCLQLSQFPNATTMKDAYLTLRLIIKQLTKCLQPIPSMTIQILSLIYQKLLESILVAPTLEDISSFSRMDAKYEERCSPYSKFLFDKNYQGGLSTVAGTTLYECLVGFLRCAQNTLTHQPVTTIEELPMFSELYNAILQLSTLPYAMSSTDLETFTRELLLPKEKQDLRVTKFALVTFVAKNLNSFNKKQ